MIQFSDFGTPETIEHFMTRGRARCASGNDEET